MQGIGIQEWFQWILSLSSRFTKQYNDAGQMILRKRYFINHPSLVIVLKCMDGRILFNYFTNKPLGIVVPFRNVGGIFNLGWAHFADIFDEMVNGAIREKRNVLVFITYHYSAGDNDHRGCAGHDYDIESSIKNAYSIKEQIEYLYGSDRQVVYPVVLGIETDSNAIIIHGTSGDEMNVAEKLNFPADKISEEFKQLFPDMNSEIMNDLTPFALGNIEHLNRVLREGGPRTTFVHQERGIFAGRAFDFMHEPNNAIIIGPFQPNLEVPARKACQLIVTNIKEEKISPDGVALLTNAPYSDVHGKRKAVLKTLELKEIFMDVMTSEFKDLKGLRIHCRTGITHWDTRHLEIIEGRKMVTSLWESNE